MQVPRALYLAMIAVVGYGRMGRMVAEIAGRDVVVCERDRTRWDGRQFCVPMLCDLPSVPQVIIDFSSPSALPSIAAYAVRHQVPVVVATTGFDREGETSIAALANEVAVYRCANMSATMPAFVRACFGVAEAMFGCRITVHEIHRADKPDAPSGTARMLLDHLESLPWVRGWQMGESDRNDTIGVTYLRIGDEVGVHRVTCQTELECVTMEHRALDRAVFARGALRVAQWLIGKPPRLYGPEDFK